MHPPASNAQRRSEFAMIALVPPVVEAGAADEERLHRLWLADIDEARRDPVTGLLVADVIPHRTTRDATLGSLPVNLAEARASAWLAATPEEREAAEQARSHSVPAASATDWRLQHSTAAIRRTAVTDLIRAPGPASNRACSRPSPKTPVTRP